jgi:hypothetical protein
MTSIKAGLYLRQGAVVTPGILGVDNDTLTFKTSEKTVFKLQANEAHINFSNYGTITVTRGQESWIFVAGAYAGAFAPKFNEEQLSELNAGENSITLAAKTKGDAVIYRNRPSQGIEPVVNSGVGYGLGVGLVLADRQRSSFYSNLALVEFLGANGFQVTIQSKKFSKSLWTIFIVLIVSLAIFGTAVYLILSSIQN